VATVVEDMNLGDGVVAISSDELRLVRRACVELERLGCELFALKREGGLSARWQAHWRPKAVRPDTLYGVSGETLSEAAIAAVMNAESCMEGMYPCADTGRTR
jgi:hypothetical protein